MADIALTAAKIAPVFPEQAEIFDMIAGATITAGQAVYLGTTGVLAVSDATTSGGAPYFDGIALTGGGAGQAISVLVRGHVAGFTVASTNVGTALHLSETAGALADAAPAGTGTDVKVGKVFALSDATPTRVVFIGGPVF